MCACALLIGCASVGGAPGIGLASGGLGRDDRIVVRAHDAVFGVAASSRHVFALTSGGLITYDRVFDRWLEPSSRVDEDLRLAGVDRARFAVMAADPVEDAVWMGVPGGVLIYRPRVEQVVRVPVVGQPEVIAFARTGGSDAYVRASGQWTRVSRGGFATAMPGGLGGVPLVPPLQLEDVYQRYPALRAQLPFLLRDAAGGALSARITSATLAPDRPSEVWVGTFGDGLWSVDANFQQARGLVYGVRDDDVGALAPGSGGVWSAGQGTTREFGLSFVHDGLQQFERRVSRAFGVTAGMRVFDLVVRGSSAWLATDRGVWRLQLNERADTRRNDGRDVDPGGLEGRRALTQWRLSDGLPDDVVLSVQPRIDGTWVGTRRGLGFIAADAMIADDPTARRTRTESVRVPGDGFAGEPVHALAASGERLFVGTSRGLFVRGASINGAAVRRVESMLPRPVSALAWHDSLLVAAGVDAVSLLSLDGALRGTASEAVGVREIGVPMAATVDARSVWVAGRSGVLAWARTSDSSLVGPPRLLRVGGELPAEVTDVVVGGEWAWVGTRAGIVRVRRASDGGLP